MLHTYIKQVIPENLLHASLDVNYVLLVYLFINVTVLNKTPFYKLTTCWSRMRITFLAIMVTFTCTLDLDRYMVDIL
jgi:hypothetical protein